VNLAETKQIAPETLASDMAVFEMYWHRQTQMLEEICRQTKRLPELFFTLAPAEWKFPVLVGLFPPSRGEKLTSQQAFLTLHLYNSMQAVLRKLVFENGEALRACGIARVVHWCMRFEFQKRGTIHVHVICWYDDVAGHHQVNSQARPARSTPRLWWICSRQFSNVRWMCKPASVVTTCCGTSLGTSQRPPMPCNSAPRTAKPRAKARKQTPAGDKSTGCCPRGHPWSKK
jgi:hypothetical protein